MHFVLDLQKMGSFFQKLNATMTAFLRCLQTEIIERQKFKSQLRAMIENQPVNFSGLDEVLIQERDRLSAVAQNSNAPLQVGHSIYSLPLIRC